ncbi:sensor histidine kinase [Actomonas aquatica]|uniref:histidine kinase n=1 Tax=Actomonas aquatica TaxID=2866162 RepID=A0ABZ1CEB0_9BACT|nr:HAMP domain-containing sensor histidine kinase [Opitutus sp. WL0086]WRQ89961.1 HAMP domain-containing sensor histidine kinase [Opitutus sp. WL0086]
MSAPARLADFTFLLVGPPDATTPIAEQLTRWGAATARIHCANTAADLAGVPVDPDAFVLTSEPAACLALNDPPLTIGGWELDPESIELPAPHFHLSAALPAAAVLEILRLARLNAEQRGQMQSIARRLTHDFMTPLGAVITTAATLQDESVPLQPEDRELVDAIAVSGEELKQLLVRIGFLLKAGLQPLDLTSVDTTDAIWELRDLIQSRLVRGQAHAHWPIDEKLPAVRGAQPWIVRMLEELVANAVQHNPTGVELTLRVQADDDHVRFSVSDNGTGNRIDRERLFVPLHHRSFVNARGWGLTIVQRLATLQNGEVFHEAPTTFGFRLPRA